MNTIWYKYIRYIIFAVPVIALAFFSYKYINPSGTLEIRYDFCKEETPYVSGLSPHGRVLDIHEKECIQEMIIDPVYFDVRLSQSYRFVTVHLDIEKDFNQKLLLGVGVDPDNWQWEFGSESDGVYRVDLSRAKFERNRYRFILSAPDLADTGEEIIFKDMYFRFEKEPLSWHRLKNKLFK